MAGFFEYFRNKALNATQWQIDRKPGDVRGKDNEHEMGFFIGGPAKIPKIYHADRAKTFFYLDVEAFRQRGGASVNPLTVPTDAGTEWRFLRLADADLRSRSPPAANPNFNPNADISASNPKYLRDQFSCNGVLNVICPARFANSLASGASSSSSPSPTRAALRTTTCLPRPSRTASSATRTTGC